MKISVDKARKHFPQLVPLIEAALTEMNPPPDRIRIPERKYKELLTTPPCLKLTKKKS